MHSLIAGTTSRPFVLVAVVVAGLTACGSDGSSESPPAALDDGDVTEGSAAEESAGGAVDATVSGDGFATLTLADGTTYEFAMPTCETSNTDEFVIPDSYELAGATADGAFRFSLTRAGLDETFITQVGTLEGAFDESGQNNQLLYVADLGDEPLSVDGANVSGTFLMNARAPERPHGDQVEATLDARC